MIFFARRITLITASIAAGIILVLSLYKNLAGIDSFHGTIFDFSILLFNKLSASMYQTIKTFCISAFMIFPIFYILEIRMHNQYIQKERIKAEEERKREESENAEKENKEPA